jgi:high affinity sulfate transporter 1
MLKHYQRAWLGKDIVAGLVLTALLVPAGMGYATAAGMPAITGLYASIVPLLAYAVFGPSRVLVLGPDSGLVALIGAVVWSMAPGDEARAIALGSMLALLTGLFCVVAGIAKVGFVTDLLSKPVRVGYMNGISLTVLVTQLPKLCGFSVKEPGLLAGTLGLVRGLAEGKLEPPALAIGGACLLLILVLKAKAPKVPGILIAVVVATLAVLAFGLEDQVALVGAVPRGVPLPSWPVVQLADLGQLVLAALGIAMVAFADTSVLSRTWAGRSRYRVDPNRELVGLGLANVAAGFFQGFPVSSSASRTPVADSAGSKTQLTGVVGAVAILVLLVAAPGLTSHLPSAALAAVVISAVLSLFDFAAHKRFFAVRRSDFVLSMVALLGVAVFGVLPGIAVAVGVSVLDVVRRAWRPHDAILGRVRGVKGYHDLKRYPDAREVPGLVLFRWDAPLFFANADTFRQRILDAVDGAATPTRWVVVAAEPITDVDTTAAEMMEELDTELKPRGVELAFAEMKDPVKDRLNRYGLGRKIGDEYFFPTLGVAVKEFLERNQVEWRDWEDEDAPQK